MFHQVERRLKMMADKRIYCLPADWIEIMENPQKIDLAKLSTGEAN
jgi:hypothetical protein